MLAKRRLLDRDGVEIHDVACRHRAGAARETEHSSGHMVVFVRRGSFVRRVDGAAVLLDPTVAYCINPGQEQHYDHPGEGGDDCTMIALDAETVASVSGGEPTLPSDPLPIPPRIDLEQRRLLTAARHDVDPDALYEHAISLVASAVALRDPRPVGSGRPHTGVMRRRLVEDARGALGVDPNRSLPELARQLSISPHHLSRVFRAHTGHTISHYRVLLRARAALERIAGGETQLARLAAELGFADQSHLCGVLRKQTGHTPTALRKLLAEWDASVER
jgi:AraC-like DNA-binding protein